MIQLVKDHLKLRWLGVLILVVLVPYLWIISCTGPRPWASNLQVQPPQSASGPYHVSAIIHTNGPGHGTVEVIFSLRDTRTQRLYQNSDTVNLNAGQTAAVGVDINAPPGSYVPIVQLQYPQGMG